MLKERMQIDPPRELKKPIETAQSLAAQIARDIEDFCSHYTNEKYALRLLAKKMEVSEKTVLRLRDQKTTPSHATLFRLYLALTLAETREEFFSRLPEVIASEIKKKEISESDFQTDTPDFDFLHAVKKQPIIGELYVLASLQGLHKNEVILRYGQFGLELLEKLVEKGLLKKVTANMYAASGRGPVFDGHVILNVGTHFLERFSKPEESKVRGRNSLAFYANSLNEEGYKKWLSIDEEAFYKKVEVAKLQQYQGDILSFTFGATDTLDPNNGGKS